MNTVESIEHNIKAQYPSCWEEHKEAQHLFILQQLDNLNDSKIKLYDFYMYVIFHFLGIEYTAAAAKRDQRLDKEKLERKHENIYRLVETIDYFFKEKDGKLLIDYNCINNLIPTVEINGQTLYGPADAFMNLCFKEFSDAQDNYIAHAKKGTQKNLNNLIAILYRPERKDYHKAKEQPNFDGERREKYNPATLEQRAQLVEQMPEHIKNGIMLYFQACYNFITTQDIKIGQDVVNFSILFKKTETQSHTPSQKKGIGLTGLLFKIAEMNVFGNIEKCADANIYDVFVMLYQKKLEADEERRAIKQRKRNIKRK